MWQNWFGHIYWRNPFVQWDELKNTRQSIRKDFQIFKNYVRLQNDLIQYHTDVGNTTSKNLEQLVQLFESTNFNFQEQSTKQR